MKAAIVKAPNTVTIESIPDPKIGPYDALCEIIATAVCNGTDNNIVNNDPYHKVKFPAVLGHEGIGRVIAVGSKVKNFKIGNLVSRVFNKLPAKSGYYLMWGAFAEKGTITDWQAMKKDGFKKDAYYKYRVHRVLPKNFDPIESTLLITWRETFSYFLQMKPRAKQKLLLIGTGGNALAFLDHAKNLNLDVSVIGSPKLIQKFVSKGAKPFISYKENSIGDILQKSGEGPFDIAIDTIGNSETLNSILGNLKSRAKIGVYGLDNFLKYKINKKKAPKGFSYFSGEKYDEASAHEAIVDLIQKKKLNAWDYISKDHIYPLEKINEALRAGEEKRVLKSVIKIN